MAEDLVKNQHYVPQVYLRNFANSKERIWVYDKEERNVFNAGVKNVACERFFYDSAEMEQVTGNRQFIEKQLCGIEGKFCEISRSLIKSLQEGSFTVLKRRHRHFFSAYMVIQMLRTKESRLKTLQMTELMCAVLKKRHNEACLMPLTDSELLQGLTLEEAARHIQSRTLLNASEIESLANILYRHVWVIQEAFANDTFLTSDHPFSKRPHIRHAVRSMNGIASPGIEILFPLSPKYLLTLVDRHHFHHIQLLDGSRICLDSHDEMIYCNQFQIFDSNRFIFSTNDNFSLVEEVLRELPIFGNPDRKRIECNRDNEIGRGGDLHKF